MSDHRRTVEQAQPRLNPARPGRAEPALRPSTDAWATRVRVMSRAHQQAHRMADAASTRMIAPTRTRTRRLTVTKWLWAISALLIAVAVATFVTAAVTGPGAQPPASTRYSHEQLQADADMTQQMSVPGASGPMADGGVMDDQLRHARDPGFVKELEAHQRGIDRMLGRGGR